MADGPGKATGPQRDPDKQPGSGPSQPRSDEARRRQAYDAVRQRMIEEAERVVMRLSELPPGDILRVEPSDDQQAALHDLERRLTMLRIELDQVGCAL